MPKKAFSAVERLAVYTVHGEKCYLCFKPIDLRSMQVDHIIPEFLAGTSKLSDTLRLLGLPADFNLQSYENWSPACAPCNNVKRDQVFDPAPIVLALLKKAAEKAPRARKLASKVTNMQDVQKALNTLERAARDDALDGEMIKVSLAALLNFQATYRAPEMAGKPILLRPGLELLSDKDGIRVVRGPYGTGGGPSTDFVSPQARCPGCGSPYFQGARCVLCGLMDDD